MIFSPVYNMFLDFIHYVYNDGYFSLKALTFYALVFFMYYDLCKHWVCGNVGIENDDFKKEDIENAKIKIPIKKSLQIEIDKEQTKEIKEDKEQLQLSKMFSSKK